MNDLIKELAEQADIHGDSYLLYQHRLEKFAALLIEECAAIADKNSPLSYPDHGIKIKRHFGVE